MTTKTRVKRLEKRVAQVLRRKGKGTSIVRFITEDKRYVDKDGYLLSEDEIKRIEEENKEVASMGGIIVNLVEFIKPKIRDAQQAP